MYLYSWPSLSCVNALGRIIRKCSWSVLLSRSQILKKFSKLRTSLKWKRWELVISLRKFVCETGSKIMRDNCACKNGENFTRYILSIDISFQSLSHSYLWSIVSVRSHLRFTTCSFSALCSLYSFKTRIVTIYLSQGKRHLQVHHPITRFRHHLVNCYFL